MFSPREEEDGERPISRLRQRRQRSFHRRCRVVSSAATAAAETEATGQRRIQQEAEQQQEARAVDRLMMICRSDEAEIARLQPPHPSEKENPFLLRHVTRKTSQLPFLSLLLFFLSSLPSQAHSLRIQDVTFPGYAMLGQTVTLVCDYRVSEGEYVDSIKWYKDGNEFYRIVPNTPREVDRVVTFRAPGVRLDRQKSGVSEFHHLIRRSNSKLDIGDCHKHYSTLDNMFKSDKLKILFLYLYPVRIVCFD